MADNNLWIDFSSTKMKLTLNHFEVIETVVTGNEIDATLMIYCMEDFRAKTAVDIKRDPAPARKLRFECERVKRRLSLKESAFIRFKNLA